MGITARIDAVTAIPERWRGAVIPAPKSVKIELTAKCNFACAFCARSEKLRDQRTMDRALYERLAPEIRGAGTEELGLFYLGESFMVDWLPEAIAYAKTVCGFPYVFLTTNGSLCNSGKLNAVMAAGLDSLKFSLNYATPEQLQEVAGVKPGIYNTILSNIRSAKAIRDEFGYSCGLYASYIQFDGDQAEMMQTTIDGIDQYLDEVYALPLYNQASLCTRKEEEKGWEPSPGNRGRVGALRDPLPCWAVFTEGHITWDGKLSACCFDHNDRFTMADLAEVSFREGWNSLAFQALREAHLKKDVRQTPCNTCVAYS